MDSEEGSPPVKKMTQSQSTITYQDHIFLPTKINELRQNFITYHKRVLPLLINYAMENNLIKVYSNETVEDAIWRWISSEPHKNLNPVPLISKPFIYTTWKSDYFKYKNRKNKEDIYTLTCDALIKYIDEL